MNPWLRLVYIPKKELGPAPACAPELSAAKVAKVEDTQLAASAFRFFGDKKQLWWDLSLGNISINKHY